jgi:hypothetical protein
MEFWFAVMVIIGVLGFGIPAVAGSALTNDLPKTIQVTATVQSSPAQIILLVRS